VPTWATATGLLVLLAVLAVVSVGVGAVPLGIGEVAAALARGLAGESEGVTDFIVWNLRAPRVVEAMLVGFGLALAGLLVQVLVRNPIADPYILGLSSGAGVGAVTALALTGTLVGFGVQGAAFAGAVAAGLVVAVLSWASGGFAATRLVLIGIAIGHLASGVMSFVIIRTSDADVAQQVMYWMLGSLSGAQWPYVPIVLAAVTAGFLLSVLTTPWLDALSLGDSAAAGMGLRAGRVRVFFFVVACALTATVVSVSGTIGFVGFVVPNLARLLVGGMHRRLVPITGLLGALLVLAADTAARTLLAPSEIPIGILTAAIGVPLFVLVVRRGLRGAI
jgi:iron complex transport system permease protein